ncbi:hypothetical protein N0V85_005695 [Neurospora sp. IMI 360204]|nr:hypothetical protein N0V85_005695 [Neurospora sp. IMI 360204]
MPAKRTLEDYLPDDTAWSKLTVERLKVQCNKRDITFTTGHRKELETLKTYRYTHNPPGKASRFGGWRSDGSDSVHRSALAEAEASTLHLIQIKDYSDLEAGLWAKNFMLTPGGEERITVVVGEENNCSCGGRGFGKTPSTRDVLRYLLNCPEPLRWQSSFLQSELGEIFRLSHLYHHFNSGGYPDPFCAICFKPMRSFTDRQQCGIGRHLVHRMCMETFTTARGLPASGSEHGCVLCDDADEIVIGIELCQEKNN